MAKKIPVVIPYKLVGNGEELRFALRSLKNIKNWNGKLILVGDRPKWLKDTKNLEYIPTPSYPFSFYDVEQKIYTALDYIKDRFILSNDDIYITEPTEVGVYHQGIIKQDLSTHHKRCKVRTRDYLADNSYNTFDFEVHAPMVMERDKRLIVHDIVKDELKSKALQPRSIYGNIFSENAERIDDKKTYTDELPEGLFISTFRYSDKIGEQLGAMFPEESEFE